MEISPGLIAFIAIVIIRLGLPLTILRWPMFGFLLAVLGDISDVMILEQWPDGPIAGSFYHNSDKFFDTYYLFLLWWVSRRWTDTFARRTATVLFWWRFAGFVVFETTGWRPAFFLSPNIFENFYLVGAIVHKWYRDYKFTAKRLVMWLIIVGTPKVLQEYVMHYKYQDQTWNFLRDHLFWWVYE